MRGPSFLAGFGIVLLFVGIQGWMNPDPTPEPVLPSGPAQMIVFAIAMLIGLTLCSISLVSLVRERRATAEMRRRNRDPWQPHEDGDLPPPE